MSITNNTKIQVVVNSKSGRIVDILDENVNSSRYRSKQFYAVFTMDKELFDRLNTRNTDVQGFDPRGTMDIPVQRSASYGSSGDDGWFYRAFSGCGDFSYDERVELDKMRAHTRSNPNVSFTPKSPYYGGPRVVGGSATAVGTWKWDGTTRGCAQEAIRFNTAGSIVLPSRGGYNGSTLDNWMISAWVWPESMNTQGMIIGKLDTSSNQGYTGPESGTSGPTGGFTGGSGDCFKLAQHNDGGIRFHWTDAADTGTDGLLNTVTVTSVISGTTGPTSGAQIPRHKWSHIAIGYRTSAAGGTVTAYVNGIRTVNQSTNGGGIKLNPHPFSIGSRFNPAGTDHDLGWRGYLDEIVIGVTSGTGFASGLAGTTLSTEYQKGASAGGTSGLGDEQWTPGYAYYMPSRGPSGCNLFDVQSGDSPDMIQRNFFEGIVTVWKPNTGRLFLRNTGGSGGYDYPTIGGGLITGMSCGAHYAVQSTGGASGSGGSGGLDIVDIDTYQEIIRNTLSSDTEDLNYVRLYGQTHNPGPTGSSTNAFCTLFFGDGSCGGFSGTTNNFGPIGETSDGPTGGGSFSFVRRPEAMEVVGELVTAINSGTSSGSCGSYTIQNAEGQNCRFTGTEVIRLWNDLTEFRRANREHEADRHSETTTITALTDGKQILDARITSLGNGTNVVIGKGTFVQLAVLESGSKSGYEIFTP